jgi:uncharacterized protein YcfL
MKKLILLLYILGLTACSSNKPALLYHQELQRELSFESRLEQNESFTQKSYNEDLKALRSKLNELEKKERKFKNQQSTLTKMEKLRAKIKEHENNH